MQLLYQLSIQQGWYLSIQQYENSHHTLRIVYVKLQYCLGPLEDVSPHVAGPCHRGTGVSLMLCGAISTCPSNVAFLPAIPTHHGSSLSTSPPLILTLPLDGHYPLSSETLPHGEVVHSGPVKYFGGRRPPWWYLPWLQFLLALVNWLSVVGRQN